MNRGLFHPDQRLLPILLMLLFAGVSGAMLWQHFAPGTLAAAAGQRTVTPREALTQGETSTINVFQQVSPSVVFIRTTAVRRDVFNRPVDEVPFGTGSGFVWDADGHVVTNFHVVQSARDGRAFVRLADGQEYQAKVIGVAPEQDLAVLKVDAEAADLKPISLGTSADLQTGQTVFAVGNPFGFDQTMTDGIVSSLGRVIKSPAGRRIEGVIQHSAAINPGNSGGPLLDSAGRMIGVNTAIFSPTGTSAGIGFAVPVDTVNRSVPQLIEFGQIRRPTLGIRFLPVGPQVLRRLEGLPVGEVIAEGPAAEAGLAGVRESADGRLQLGDIIKQIDDRRVRSIDDLQLGLEAHKPGDAARLRVWQNGREREVDITLGDVE